MPYRVRFHWQAEAALNALSPTERNLVTRAIEGLQERDVAAGGAVRQVESAGSGEPLYVLRTGDALSVMFTVEAGNVLSIQDVINRRFAQRYG